jgi:hypothetical protein
MELEVIGRHAEVILIGCDSFESKTILCLAPRPPEPSDHNVAELARRRVKRVECKILFRKPEGATPLGKTRRRLEDNIKMSVKGAGGEVME